MYESIVSFNISCMMAKVTFELLNMLVVTFLKFKKNY
jgi:hypothetical protein